MVIYERDYYYPYPASLAARAVNLIIGLIEAAFALRIILRLLAANPSSPFVAWVYNATDRLLGPFAGALPVLSLGGSITLELSVVLAMVGYSILGWLIIRLLYFVFFSLGTSVESSEHQAMPLRGL